MSKKFPLNLRQGGHRRRYRASRWHARYSPEKIDGFHVEVVNQLSVPTSIHGHGLILPNLMDGVPFVTQNPIAPGDSFRYDFPLKQSGTYWMHSHYGLQEDWGLCIATCSIIL